MYIRSCQYVCNLLTSYCDTYAHLLTEHYFLLLNHYQTDFHSSTAPMNVTKI